MFTTVLPCGSSFRFVERTITGNIYLDLLQQFIFHQVDNTERENATGVKFRVFWDVAPCIHVEVDQREYTVLHPRRL
jgi:hypothetical protein